MEQHGSRPPNDGPRRGTPQQNARLPPQARRGAGGERRPGQGQGTRRPGQQDRGAPRAGAAARQIPPGPRLTGLGSGLFCVLAMFLLGCLDTLLFGESMRVYGVLFLPVCVLTALWVRAGDVLTAPVVVPIAFAAGMLPVAGGGGGLPGRLMGLFTGLATQAGWLYGGTLVAGVIVLVRRVQWVRRRRRRW
ncbi:DUF6542 domain-containing protein [Streptomyces sp. RB17]|uniref:DUF6542 domain-containing protein n=1 Tax=Streptomyces sp. RB17 TaxID=2585197 RepID=UPI002B21B4F0|nr:DUF6542 domain-containing protein [Streptomyces sp. RB17]